MLIYFVIVGLFLGVVNGENKTKEEKKEEKVELETIPVVIAELITKDPYNMFVMEGEVRMELKGNYSHILVDVDSPGIEGQSVSSCAIIKKANDPEDPTGPIYKSFLDCLGFDTFEDCNIPPGVYVPKMKCTLAVPKDKVDGVKKGEVYTDMAWKKLFIVEDLFISLQYDDSGDAERK